MKRADDLILRTNKDEELNREGFKATDGIINFSKYFIDFSKLQDMQGEENSYRQTPHFKRFQLEFPDLEKEVTERVTDAETIRTSGWIQFNRDKEFIDRCWPELYRAYNIMREYVGKDWILFRDLD